MKELILTQKQIALVDDEDYEKVKFFRWYAYFDPAMHGYVAQRNEDLPSGKRVTIYLHRVVMDAPKGMVVDHINHNLLDNRRINLRVCTHAENMLNRKTYANNKTGYKGVSWHKGKNKFGAGIRANNKKYFLGYFENAKEAAQAYNEASLKYHKEFGSLNII